MKMFLKKAGILAAGILVLFSCGDSDLLKFDKIEGIKNWEPDYTLQLAYANYDVWRLVEQANDGDSTIIQRDNRILIRHLQKDICSLRVKDVMDLPQDIADFALHASLPAVSAQPLPGDLSVDIPADTVNIHFEDGELTKLFGSVKCRYELPSVGFDYQVEVLFTNVLLTSTGEPVRLLLSGNDMHTGSVVLDDLLFDMTSAPNRLEWQAHIFVPAGETLSVDELNMSFRFSELTFTRAEGKMQPREVAIDEDEFSMDVEFWNNFEGSFNFADPRVDLIVRNYGLGVPVEMDMELVAYGDHKSLPLRTKNGYRPAFEGWVPDGPEVTEIKGYNASNSNIDTLLSLPPKDRITYSGKIIIAPDADQNLTILSEGYARADAQVEIPLYLSARNLVFNDTIDDIDISDADKIKAAKIMVRAVNQVPLALGEGRLYLLNGAQHCIDSVEIEHFIEAPDLNADGEVIPSDTEKEAPPIVLSEENIQHLNDTKYIVISVKATTSKNGEVPVVIKADAMLKLKLILGVKLNLEDL